MTISDGVGDLVSVPESGPGNTNPLPGGITYDGSIGVWNVVINTGLTKPTLGSPANPIGDITIQASAAAAGNLYVAFSETSYTAPGALQATISGNVVTGAPEMAAFQVLGNPANMLGTLNGAAVLSNGGGVIDNIPNQPVPISTSTIGSLSGLGSSYSLTELITISASGATFTSVDAGFAPVPEPGSLMLLTIGLSTLAVRKRRVVS